MTWTPPEDWQDSLRDALSAAAMDANLSMLQVGKRMGARNRTTPLGWMQGNVDALPNVKSLVRYCAALGVRPSDVLREAGL